MIKVVRASAARGEKTCFGALCVETQSRQIMSELVHDVVAEAFRLNLHGASAERVEKANGARLKTRGQGENV